MDHPKLLKDMPDDFLLEMYHNCRTHLGKRNYNPIHRMEIRKDLTEIEKEINSRIPVDFQWEIEKIQQGTKPANDIEPGYRFRHKMVSMIELQVVDCIDYNGPLWTVRAWCKGIYLCRFIVKTATILEHFQKL